LCPPILNNIWAIFIPFKHKIIMYALNTLAKEDKGNWHYKENIYNNLWL
jgi:hypothetical protein